MPLYMYYMSLTFYSIMLQQTLAETAKMILKLQEIQQVRLSKVEQDGTICSPKQEEKALGECYCPPSVLW